MASTLPWLGMDDDADKDLELLIAFKHQKESTRQKKEANLLEMSLQAKVKNVVMGETVAAQRQEGISVGEALKMSYATMRQQNAVVCVLSMSGLMMQLCEVEVLYTKNNEVTPMIEGMKAFVTISSVLSVVFLCMWYRLFFDIKRLTNSVLEGDTLASSGYLGMFVLEVVVLLLHAPPGVLFEVDSIALDEQSNTWRTVTYTSDEVILTAMFFRFYVVMRAIMQSAGLQDEKAQAVATLYQEEVEGLFVIKKFVFMNPLLFLSAVVFCVCFSCSYWILIFERVTNDKLNTVQAALWLVVTSMTKTGYGDVYPVSLMGRITIYIVCVAAVVIVTCSMLAMFSFMQPTNRQLKVIQAIVKSQNQGKISNSAARTIQRFWKRWNGMVFDPANPDRSVADLRETAVELRQFRDTRRGTMTTIEDPFDLLRTELIDFKNDLVDTNGVFDDRIAAMDKTLHGLRKKIDKYLAMLDHYAEKMESTVKELEEQADMKYD